MLIQTNNQHVTQTRLAGYCENSHGSLILHLLQRKLMKYSVVRIKLERKTFRLSFECGVEACTYIIEFLVRAWFTLTHDEAN